MRALSKSILAAAAALAFATPTRARAADTLAIEHVRIVTPARPVIETGTIVIRDGRITAVAARAVVPTEGSVIDGSGLTAYPGLIDLGNRSCMETSPAPPASNPTLAQIQERKRARLLRPHLDASDECRIDRAALQRFAVGGVTTALMLPPGEGFTGRSLLMAITGGDSSVVDADSVLSPRVAIHLTMPTSPAGDGYPDSLMGMIAFVRQTFLDAQHRREWTAWSKRTGREAPPPDAALDSLLPALARETPVVIEAASAREIRRALSMAREFGLEAIISGAIEAGEAADDLAVARARVIFGLRFPTRPRSLGPDADEPLRILRQRVNAPNTPRALARARVAFAFESDGLKSGADFLAAARRVVGAGLPPETALRALTLDAAQIAGVADLAGSLEVGKRADILLTDGDLFAPHTKVRRVFVGGRAIAGADLAPIPQSARARAPERR